MNSALSVPQVDIYTDGAARPNPGVGGCAAILRCKGQELVITCGYEHTTNNRMELLAVILGVEALDSPCDVTIHTDAEYVSKPLQNGRLDEWQENDWFLNQSKTRPVKNADLWQRLLGAIESHEWRFVWVKGHSGNVFNERCDKLAVAARSSSDLQTDHGYQSVAASV